MALRLDDLIYKKGADGKLTTGAKIGAGVLSAAAVYALLSNKKNKQGAGIEGGFGQGEGLGTGIGVGTTTDEGTDNLVGSKKEAKGGKTLLYVGIGVAALAVVGVVIYFVNKKK
jgi:hypothetical protein